MSPQWAYQQVRAGTFPIPVHRLGRKVFVSRILLERYLEGAA